jgi:F-type H+-transporting ATPase subunit a
LTGFIRQLLVVLVLAVALAAGLVAWAQHEPAHRPSDADSVTGTPAAHGERSEGMGAVIVEVLEHHLVDSDQFEIFGFEIKLPTTRVGPFWLFTKHQVWWLIAMLLAFVVIRLAGRQTTVVPSGVRNALEVIAVFIRDEILRPNLHGYADRLLPYFLTLFTCILFSNLLGLLPWGSSATGNISVTAGLALCSLGLIVGMGVRENGVSGFLQVFTPPGVPLWLMPLMVVVEIASFFIRPFALTIRLFANMLAGHAVVAVLFGLIVAPLFAVPSLAVAVGVTMLEILVALIQSYIFVILTAVFVGITMHPAH